MDACHGRMIRMDVDCLKLAEYPRVPVFVSENSSCGPVYFCPSSKMQNKQTRRHESRSSIVRLCPLLAHLQVSESLIRSGEDGFRRAHVEICWMVYGRVIIGNREFVN